MKKLAFLLTIFSSIAFAEDYQPMTVTWDRPTERESGAAIDPSEPLVYQIYCDISAGQGDEYVQCGFDVEGLSFTYVIDNTRTGLDGGTVAFKGKTCDAGTSNCSTNFSNEVVRPISLIKSPPVAPVIQ